MRSRCRSLVAVVALAVGGRQVLGQLRQLFANRRRFSGGQTVLHCAVEQEARRHFPRHVFRTVIPRNVRLSEAPGFGQPIITFDSTSKGAKAYRDLAKEVSHGTARRSG